jgi:hypothetical protein
MKFKRFVKLDENFSRTPDFEDTGDQFDISGAELDSFSNLSDEEFDDLDRQYENPPKEPFRPSKDEEHPNWMTIDSVPDFMKPALKMFGRTVLKTLTKADLKDVQILANLQHVGPTSHEEINATAAHAAETHDKVRDLEHVIDGLIPGYEVNAKLYSNPQDTYLVLSDDMGEYIYHWPTHRTIEKTYTKTKKKKS